MNAKTNKTMIGVVSMVLFAAGYLVSSSLQAQTERKASIFGIDGVVDVQKAGTTQWIPAEKGMEVGVGDTLRTSLDSIADVLLDDGSTLRLAEESQVTLESLVASQEKARFLFFLNRPVDAKKTKLKLAQGRVLANVTPLTSSQSTFRVETPKGVAGVRGTSWYVGTDDLGCRDGFIIWAPPTETQAKDAIGKMLNEIQKLLSGPQPGRDTDLGVTQMVNEGIEAKVKEDGQLIDFSSLSRERLEEMTRVLEVALDAKAITEIPDTRSQQAANTYIIEQIVPVTTTGGTLSDPFKDQWKHDQGLPGNPSTSALCP